VGSRVFRDHCLHPSPFTASIDLRAAITRTPVIQCSTRLAARQGDKSIHNTIAPPPFQTTLATVLPPVARRQPTDHGSPGNLELWKTCQAFRARYRSVVPDLQPLSPQQPPTYLADFLAQLGILIIGGNNFFSPPSNSNFVCRKGGNRPCHPSCRRPARHPLPASSFHPPAMT
jgi:hypothetical protein